MPNPNWYSIKAEAGAVAAIAVRGYIGEFGLTDSDFARDLAAAGEVEQISVTINSRGGEVDHALAIYDLLRSHKARVTVRITGMAASAASIIAMAGDEISMPANSLMMIHNPWTCAAGNAEDLRQVADSLDKVTSALVQTYSARTGKDEEEIKQLLDAETWLTADEALALGFADTVEPIKTKALNALADAVQIPAAVLAKLEAIEAPGQAEAPAQSDTQSALDALEAATAKLEALAAAEQEIQSTIPQPEPDARPQQSPRAIWERVIQSKARSL